MQTIYLDHAATTPVRPEVVEAMMPYFSEDFGNASSLHAYGQRAKRALEDARELLAACLGGEPDEICFTGGGTESDNLAIKGLAYATRGKGRHVITSTVEHHAVLNCCKHLERHGHEVSCLPVDRNGVIDLDDLAKSMRRDTVLVSMMLANNETGTLQPVAEAASLAKSRGVAIHTDAIQALGKIPVRVDDLGVDLLSLSGHKINAPKGVGCLFIRRRTRIEPLLHGGPHERRKRPGTENIALIAGFAKAVSLATAELSDAAHRLGALRDKLEQEILARLPGVQRNGHPEKRLPNMTNLGFAGVPADAILLALDTAGIAVSAGSACTSGAIEPSHVLKAMGVDPAVAQGSLRFSVGRGNTAEEMVIVARHLAETLERLQRRV